MKLKRKSKGLIVGDDLTVTNLDRIVKAVKEISNEEGRINLDDIKTKDDFLDFGNWIKYASKIFELRGFVKNQPIQISTNEITIDEATKIGNKLGFKVKYKEYR